MNKSAVRWIDPRCAELDLPPGIAGPFVEMADGSLMTVDGNATRVSQDNGSSWSDPRPIYEGPKPGIPGVSSPFLDEIGDRMGWLVLRTHDGTLVLLYIDRSTHLFAWDDSTGKPVANLRADVWAIRSLDKGQTWVDRQMIMEGYCGALITMIQTKSGKVVVPVQQMMYDPGRSGTQTFVSADDGKTWKRSNIIDLGGHGHHDGGFEATLAELGDGRLLMLIRTPLDQFWQALSTDEGLSWRVIRPTGIDASNAPGYLARLASGRLVFVWNWLYPQGENGYVRSSGQSTQVMSSHHREELSIAFSEDDSSTWNEPVVLAVQKRGSPPLVLDARRKVNMDGLSYPWVYERRPGELWVTSRFQGHLRVSINEEDFAS